MSMKEPKHNMCTTAINNIIVKTNLLQKYVNSIIDTSTVGIASTATAIMGSPTVRSGSPTAPLPGSSTNDNRYMEVKNSGGILIVMGIGMHYIMLYVGLPSQLYIYAILHAILTTSCRYSSCWH